MATLQVTRLAARTTQGVAVLAPFTPRTVDSLSTVTVTAVVSSGAPDDYTWRVISGAATLTGSGATRSFLAPAALDGTTVTVGVAPVTADATGAEQTATVTVRPHTMWARAGGAWVWAAWRSVVENFDLAASAEPGLYDLVADGQMVAPSTTPGGYYATPDGGLTLTDGFYTGV